VLYSPQRISAVAEWLARAGACPLSLSVVAWWSQPFLDFGSRTNLMSILINPSSCWRNIELVDLPPFCLSMLDDVTAPILETIRVKSDDVVHPIYTLLKGHEIRRVSLTQPDLGFFTQTLPLLWDRLTHLALLNEDADMSVALSSITFSILRKCPSLVYSR
jgi:hypothetical protein